VAEGFAEVSRITGLKGRWQVISEAPLTVCDTGHNVAGWTYLSQQISQVECFRKHIVFGAVEDKDIDGMMALLPKDAIYYFTKAKNHRAISENVLKVLGNQIGLKGESYPSVAVAVEAARSEAVKGDFIFIGGSSYIVADFLKSYI
jgi:dihydrofolate synthase/folylpolyglutamate synthase